LLLTSDNCPSGLLGCLASKESKGNSSFSINLYQSNLTHNPKTYVIVRRPDLVPCDSRHVTIDSQSCSASFSFCSSLIGSLPISSHSFLLLVHHNHSCLTKTRLDHRLPLFILLSVSYILVTRQTLTTYRDLSPRHSPLS
jgi:hypothetical protein